MDDGRISRVTFPTASFTLTTDIIDWIAQQAKEANQSKSEFVRRYFERGMNVQETTVVEDGEAA